MPTYMEFEVTLAGTKPRVWRRFQMRGHGRSLLDLHTNIQDACGWEEAHLWSFQELKRPHDTIATIPDQGGMAMGVDPFTGRKEPQAHMVSLQSVFKEPGDKIDYWYDFGDDWHHTIVLKKFVETDEKFERRLTAGRLAFPPEDCGGIYGYYTCVAACPDQKILSEEEAAELNQQQFFGDRRDWLEEMGWDPHAFDLQVAKKQFDIGHEAGPKQWTSIFAP